NDHRPPVACLTLCWSPAAHKLHRTPQQDRMNLISGKGETSSRLPAFSLLLPGSCPNYRDRRSAPGRRGSDVTPRWRKPDSNSQSHLETEPAPTAADWVFVRVYNGCERSSGQR